MVEFREKTFGAWSAYKKNAPAIISTAALGISTANLATNKKRSSQAEDHNKQQLAAMSNLTKELKNTAQSMKDVNATMKEKGVIVAAPPQQEKPRKRRSIFRW